MSEISKLKQRLSNVGKNVIEYRMTIIEAKELLFEIEELSKPKEKLVEVVVNEPHLITRSIDGGQL